jgi:hypothetical protein
MMSGSKGSASVFNAVGAGFTNNEVESRDISINPPRFMGRKQSIFGTTRYLNKPAPADVTDTTKHDITHDKPGNPVSWRQYWILYQI